MESRQFIATSASLIRRIKDQDLLISTVGDNQEEGDSIQKGIHAAFLGLQNPTLPSAYKLRDVALQHGYTVDTRVQHRLTQGESCWGN